MDDRLDLGSLVESFGTGAPQVGPLLRPGRGRRAAPRRRRQTPLLRSVNNISKKIQVPVENPTVTKTLPIIW